jgi:hypothetical protein
MRVDGDALRAECQLNQAKVRVVAALTVKLAVEAELLLVGQAFDDLEESGVRSDVGWVH